MTQTTDMPTRDNPINPHAHQRFVKESAIYVNRIRNKAKKAYAIEVRMAWVNHYRYESPMPDQQTIDSRDLTFMARQAVWQQLNAIKHAAYDYDGQEGTWRAIQEAGPS